MANEANTGNTDGEAEAGVAAESASERTAEPTPSANEADGGTGGTNDSNGETADADPGAAEGDVAEGNEVESLRADLVTAQAGLEAAEDRALRAVAEAENVRKRADRSIQNARKYALERFVTDLLPAVDSFERAAEAAQAVEGEAASAMAEGIGLSLKLLMEAMRKQGIEVVDPIGAPFDPKLHEAMSVVDSDEAEPGAIVQVFQKGYTVNGRLARAARVIVAREPAPAAGDPAASPEGKA